MWKENLKIGWREASAQSRLKELLFFAVAVKTNAKAGIKTFWLKLGIFCLNWNLAARLIRLHEFSGSVNFFYFGLQLFFLGKYCLKIKSYLIWNWVSRLTRKCRIRRWCSLFYFILVKPFLAQINFFKIKSC